MITPVWVCCISCRILVPCKLAHCHNHGLLGHLNRTESSLKLLVNTCAFPTMSQNVCCKKDLFLLHSASLPPFQPQSHFLKTVNCHSLPVHQMSKAFFTRLPHSPAHLFSLPSSVTHYIYQPRSFVPLPVHPSCFVAVLCCVFAFEFHLNLNLYLDLNLPTCLPVTGLPFTSLPACKLFSTLKRCNHPTISNVCIWVPPVSKPVTLTGVIIVSV